VVDSSTDDTARQGGTGTLRVSEVSGSRVLVEASGFQTGAQLVLLQCSAEAGPYPSGELCFMRPDRYIVEVEADGTFTQEFEVTPFIGVGVRREIDCLLDGCIVGVIPPDRSAVMSSDDLEFPPDFPSPEAPSLEIDVVEPYEENAATAQVAGTGFSPGSTVRLSQCPLGTLPRSVDAEDCLYDYGLVTAADENGRVSGQMQVFQQFQRSDGELIDCVVTPEICVVADPFPESGDRMAIAGF